MLALALLSGFGGGNFWAFFVLFMPLFTAAGVGNASTFRMVPLMFHTILYRLIGRPHALPPLAVARANKEAAAVLGFISAIAAYGALFVPMSYGTAMKIAGGPDAAFFSFAGFYVTCIAVTWWYYSRRAAEIRC